METSQYLDVFIDESMEHLATISEQILELEKTPEEKSIIEEIFRAAHTIKGMSATMGYEDLANLTHNLENVFDGIRYDKVSVSAELIDVMFDAVDHLNTMVEDIAGGGDGKRNVEEQLILLKKIETGEPIVSTEDKKVQTETVVAGSDSELELDEFELTILNESTEQGYTNYEIKVELSENCLLKGARVFMVFEVLEQIGEVIKSDPPVHELEEENFEYSFSVILVSKDPENEIKEKVKKVSEVSNVTINPFLISQYTEKREEKTKTKQEPTEAASKEMEKEKKKPTKDVRSTGQVARQTIRVNIDRLDILMNLFEELVIDRGRLEQISSELNHNDLKETVERMSRVSGDLQNIILNMRMVPIESVFNRFPRMIRQLARELEKDIGIDIIGADTELDRTVIDEIGDPLVHLIRNAIDHGIETPEERIKNGKPSKGMITLQAYQGGNYVFIEISDDGAGINKDKVLDKAISNGVVSIEQSELLTDQQIYELILESGFSTAESVSDVSGRGVGLDVVKSTIEKLGGSISINASIGQGSTFSIQLPLTLSIITALLVELQHEKYAIPLSSIIETVILHKDDILSAHNKKVIDFRGSIVPLAFLNEIFDVPGHNDDSDYISVVIVKRGDKTAGLVVDSFIGQQEVVLKPLGAYLKDIPAISGATILGNGQVALIVDSNALIK